MLTVVKKDVSVAFGSYVTTGSIFHDPERNVLVFDEPNEPSDVISTNLSHYGQEPQRDTVFIKDWSEHSGLTDSLVKAGVVEIVRILCVGPFSSTACEVRVLTDDAASGAVSADTVSAETTTTLERKAA